MTRLRRYLFGLLNSVLGLLGLKIITGKRFSRRRFPATGFRTYPDRPEQEAQVVRLAVVDAQGKPTPTVKADQPVTLEAAVAVHRPVGRMNISFMIHDDYEPFVSATHSAMVEAMPISWPPGRYRVRAGYPAGLLNRGVYYVRVGLGWVDNTNYDYHADGLRLEIIAPGEVRPHSIYSHGLLAVIPDYTVEAIESDPSDPGVRGK